MILDNVEYKENIDQTVTPDSRVSCNQIKTKLSSFQNIKNRWIKFRLSRLNQRLENKKNDLVTTVFGAGSNGLTAGAERALERKTNAIARLEEKIKVLSKEDVPALYVQHRAIKLREKMMRNLTFNCAYGYSVGKENYDKVFGPEVVAEVPPLEASLANANGGINVEQVSAANGQNIATEVSKAMSPNPTLDRSEMKDAIVGSLSHISIPEVPAAEQGAPDATLANDSPIDKDTIQKVVEQSTGAPAQTAAPRPVTPVVVPEQTAAPGTGTPAPEQTAAPGPMTPTVSPAPGETSVQPTEISKENISQPSGTPAGTVTVSPEEVQKTVNTPPVSAIDYSGLEKAVAAAVDGVTVKNVVPPTDFAEEMRLRKEKYNYVPMTDEEIEEARKRIAYDSYESVDVDQWSAVRKHLGDVFITDQWKAIGDYYHKVGLGEQWDIVRGRVINSSVNKRWDAKQHHTENQFEEFSDHYFGAIPVEWDVVRKRFQDEEVLSHFDIIRQYYVGAGLGEQWDSLFDQILKVDQEKAVVEEQAPVEKEVPEQSASEKPVEEETEKPVEKPVREPIVVVPEREESPVKENVTEDHSQEIIALEPEATEKPKELHFDYSKATENDVVRATTVESSKSGLEALKERLLKLKEEHKQSEIELTAARDEQTDEARKAMEVREANKAKKQAYEESLKRLQVYCEQLEEQTKVNYGSARISRNDTACNRRFIEMQTAEMRDYDDKIKEIDSIISSEGEKRR